MIYLKDGELISYDTTPGRFVATFCLPYDSLSHDITIGASVDVDGIVGRVLKKEILFKERTLLIDLHIAESVY